MLPISYLNTTSCTILLIELKNAGKKLCPPYINPAQYNGIAVTYIIAHLPFLKLLKKAIRSGLFFRATLVITKSNDW